VSTALIDTLDSIARDAAVLIREVYRTDFSVDFKAPRDPVTEADRRANELICERLLAQFPGVPIVAEESEPETFAEYLTAERIFFVDPLDGTREFVAKNGEFVVMIGFVDGPRATASVIHAPESSISWIGQVGVGAFQVNADGTRLPITVSTTAALSEARIVGSRSHRDPLVERALASLSAREIVALGSAGLKRWDACAADALITAAGGKLTDNVGELFDYRAADLGNNRGIIASNGHVHDSILERLATVQG
jgi:3'(2'), 5'-bisphosphate nucleotidase